MTLNINSISEVRRLYDDKALLKLDIDTIVYDNGCVGCSEDLKVLYKMMVLGYYPIGMELNGHGGYKVIFRWYSITDERFKEVQR